MSTPDRDRFDLIHDEYLEEWQEANLRHLYEACADYIPPEPEVMAILAAWENGNGEFPWEDAQPSARLRLIPNEDKNSSEEE